MIFRPASKEGSDHVLIHIQPKEGVGGQSSLLAKEDVMQPKDFRRLSKQAFGRAHVERLFRPEGDDEQAKSRNTGSTE